MQSAQGNQGRAFLSKTSSFFKNACVRISSAFEFEEKWASSTGLRILLCIQKSLQMYSIWKWKSVKSIPLEKVKNYNKDLLFVGGQFGNISIASSRDVDMKSAHMNLFLIVGWSFLFGVYGRMNFWKNRYYRPFFAPNFRKISRLALLVVFKYNKG